MFNNLSIGQRVMTFDSKKGIVIHTVGSMVTVQLDNGSTRYLDYRSVVEVS